MTRRILFFFTIYLSIVRIIDANDLLTPLLPLTPQIIFSTILDKNFDLKISDFNNKEKESEISKAYGEFDTNLKYSFIIDKNDIPSSSSLDTAGDSSSVITKNNTHNFQLTKTFENGIKLDVPYIYKTVDSNSSSRLIAKSYEPSLTISVSCPIIKTFDQRYFVKNIESKNFDFKIALNKHQEEIQTILSDALELYYDVVESYHSFLIAKLSLKNAQENQSFTLEKYNVGKISVIDLLDAESATKLEEESLIKSENDYKLKFEKLISKVYGENCPPLESFKLPDDISIDNIDIEGTVPEERLVAIALENRPEIKKGLNSIEQAQGRLQASKIDLYPLLDLKQELTFRGMSNSASAANSDIIEREYASWKIALSLERKIGHYAAKSAFAINQLKLEQEQIKALETKGNILLEVKQSRRKLINTKYRIEALTVSLKAQEEKYLAILQKYKIGMATMFEVNESLKDKIAGEVDLLKARISVKKGLISLYKSQGILIDKLLSKDQKI